MNIPIYVTVSVIAACAFAVIATPIVLARATRAAGLPPWNTAVAGVVLGLWVVAASILSVSGALRPRADVVVPAVGIALLLGLAGMAVAFRAFPRFRAALEHPRAQAGLLGLQVWRIEGLAFLALMAGGQLPALFAVPAGLGDLAIGLSAPWMARRLHRRRLAIAWNLLGLLDLVVAVSLGVMTSPGAARVLLTTPTSEALGAFPLALVPMLLVPLSIGLHVVSLRTLWSTRIAAWPTARWNPAQPS